MKRGSSKPVMIGVTPMAPDEEFDAHQFQRRSPGFRLTFIGKQGLSRQNNTGFGGLQRALRELYFNYLSVGSDANEKANERTVIFQESGVSFRYWDSSARQFQQDTYPFDSVTYLDLVHFHTVKGRKKRFGYFRRHSDAEHLIPESVLIPLHRREHRLLRRMTHKPILCLVTRRPYGIQFLEGHLFVADTQEDGLAFVEEFDVRSRAKREAEQLQHHHHYHQNLQRYTPWHDRGAAAVPGSAAAGAAPAHRFWGSQPLLFHQQQTLASDISEPDLTPRSTARSNQFYQQQQQPSKEALVQRYRELQPLNLTSEYDDEDMLNAVSSGPDADVAASRQMQPPPLPPRRRLPPAGGVRVLPWGPAPQQVARGGGVGGGGGGGSRGGYWNGNAKRDGVTAKQQQPKQQHPLEGVNLDEVNAGAIDFGTALGYLP